MAERKTKYCSNCGAEIDARAKICPKCGVEQVQEVSSVWYLVPLFFGIIGGIIAWVVNNNRNPEEARNLLFWGMLSSVFAWVILEWIIMILSGGF